MKASVRIALIGEYNPEVRAHVAIPKALKLVAEALACAVEPDWVATPLLDQKAEKQLSAFDSIWCVPGSPYASMQGALEAIRFARESGRPFLGTCGGFQHALIEYARNVLGIAEADHAETAPGARVLFIAPLACSLEGKSGTIHFRRGSKAAVFYGDVEAQEKYHCNFGLNPEHQSRLEEGAMAVTGVDDDGAARVVELRGHPFFLATLFQPELSALGEPVAPHPLITAFVRAGAAGIGNRPAPQD